MEVQQFIRKLNNTELNSQSTNDAYVRLSKDIQNGIPNDFFDGLDSQKIDVLNRKTMEKVESWVRYQYYPSNKECRIVNLNSLYKSYNPSPGDYVYLEKIQIGKRIYYEIYMRTYQKVCLKYYKSNKYFEILNEVEALKMDFLHKELTLNFDGKVIRTSIALAQTKKKRADSPMESRFYKISSLPPTLYSRIKRDSFVEIYKRSNEVYIDVLDSWHFNKFTK